MQIFKMGSALGLRLQLPKLSNCRDFQFFFIEPVRLLLNSYLKIGIPCVRNFNVKCSIVTSKKELDKDSLSKKTKKKIPSDSQKILLEDLNGKLSSLYLEEAQKLAKRKGYQLLSLDSIGKKNTYKLVGVQALLEENQSKKKDPSKKFLITTTFKDNDLNTKFVQISKLLQKGKTVVIVLQNNTSDSSLLEKTSTQIENEFKNKFKLIKCNLKESIKFKLSPIEAKQEDGVMHQRVFKEF